MAQTGPETFVFLGTVEGRAKMQEFISRYHVGRALGKGSFGTVKIAQDKRKYPTPSAGLFDRKEPLDRQADYLALKFVETTAVEDWGVDRNLIREISALKELHNHINIVQLFFAAMGPGHTILGFEFFAYDLNRYIRERTKPLDPVLVVSYAFQLLNGVDYMHRKAHLHLDLKPHNILIDATGILKITDFGLTRGKGMKLDQSEEVEEMVVTEPYRPPELFFGQLELTEKIDMWSVGCIIYELVTMERLFFDDPDYSDNVLDVIFSKLGPPDAEEWPQAASLPDYPGAPALAKYDKRAREKFFLDFRTDYPEFGQRGADLLDQLLALTPRRRPAAKQILLHPFFLESNFLQSLRDCHLAPPETDPLTLERGLAKSFFEDGAGKGLIQ